MQVNAKKDLRERILTLLRTQEEEKRLTNSLSVWDKLLKMQEFQDSSTILFYASFDGEVETMTMIKEAQRLGKKVALPNINREKNEIIPRLVENIPSDLESGPYGIRQPKESATRELDIEDIDMVVVPGVAFDMKNNRLGRGGGYYDRFLKKLPAEIPSVGLAFDFQLLKELPQVEETDVPVSHVLTN